jgi:hypothetical protein
MRILFTSDWHLDAITDGVMRYDEISRIVDLTVQIAIEDAVDYYVFVGDLCDPDGWNATRSMCKIIEVAGKCAERDIGFIAVAGNHDVIEDGLGSTTLSPLAASGLATHVFERPGEIFIPKWKTGKGNLHVVGFPFTPSSHAYDPAVYIRRMTNTRPGDTTLVLEHLNIAGAGAGSETKDFARGREVVFPSKVARKKWPKATFIGGHYHNSQEIETVNVVGSLARLRHDEEKHNPSVLVLDIL